MYAVRSELAVSACVCVSVEEPYRSVYPSVFVMYSCVCIFTYIKFTDVESIAIPAVKQYPLELMNFAG